MSRPAPVPDGYTTVTPWIIVRGADGFLEFLKEVLGARSWAACTTSAAPSGMPRRGSEPRS
jgi:hypothetical protein